MRITEFANPTEQLALWKLVSDNVWSALEQQAQQQAEQDAAEKLKPKRSRKSSSSFLPHAPTTSPPLKPKQAATEPLQNKHSLQQHHTPTAANPPITTRQPHANPNTSLAAPTSYPPNKTTDVTAPSNNSLVPNSTPSAPQHVLPRSQQMRLAAQKTR